MCGGNCLETAERGGSCWSGRTMCKVGYIGVHHWNTELVSERGLTNYKPMQAELEDQQELPSHICKRPSNPRHAEAARGTDSPGSHHSGIVRSLPRIHLPDNLGDASFCRQKLCSEVDSGRCFLYSGLFPRLLPPRGRQTLDRGL